MNKFRPKLHITPSKGWMNDPNGFSYALGKFHVFAQHNPFKTEWGPMHWLHFISDDLITFKEVGIALKPDQYYDQTFGCFSGSAIEINQQHLLFYTGVVTGKQQQCLALSSDGQHYEKYRQNPIIGEDKLPVGYSISDFRDPFVFFRHNEYFLLVSARKMSGGSAILMYKSLDAIHYNFVGVTLETSTNEQEMIECPAVIFSGEESALIYSIQFRKDHNPYAYQNVHSSVYCIGNFDYITGRFIASSVEKELDHGFDFYAPQTMEKDGKSYLIAWQNMWDRSYPSSQHGYAGQLTLVRELSLDKHNLYQKFVPQLANYHHSIVEQDNFIIEDETFRMKVSRTYRLLLEMLPHGRLNISFVNDGRVSMMIDFEKHLITFNRDDIKNNNGGSTASRTMIIEGDLKRFTLDIVVDECSLEVLINEGIQSFTMTFFNESESSLTITSVTSQPILIRKCIYHDLKNERSHHA